MVAWQFGCTVRELKSRMTHVEWRKWQRFLHQQPDLFNRTDYYMTWLILEVKQLMHSKKRDVIPEIPKWLLRFRHKDDPKGKESPEDRKKRLREQSEANKKIMRKIRGQK